MTDSSRLKVLVFVVAYNASKTIRSVIDRIPKELSDLYNLSLLVIDDCSQDDTADIARSHLIKGHWSPYCVMRNPRNQGYGGNQKIGYRYAEKKEFDVVVLLHGDGQYAPEFLPKILEPFSVKVKPDAVFGSRMLNRRDALKGGMPFYKFLGNQILTTAQNFLLSSNLSEFHTGYRAYSVSTIKKLPLELNTDDFHFDTEIIVQLLFSDAYVIELPIPTFYGDEICHVNGINYAWHVLKASLKARLIRVGVFFDPKFASVTGQYSNYVSKFDFNSTHSVALDLVPHKSVVLDLGCADGYLSEALAESKQCKVYSVDFEPNKNVENCEYQSCDLNETLPDVPWESLGVVILLDVIEHLSDPEFFLEQLRTKLSGNEKVRIIISSGNVCFFITRLMMLMGQFNYGPRGILDITHRRLFTVGSLNRLLRYSGHVIEGKHYIPAPYPLAIGLNFASRMMVGVNRVLAKILPGVFAYQALYEIRPRPSTTWLLSQASD